MLFDLRIVAIAASFILSSIAVAAAGEIVVQPSRVAAATTDSTSEARPIRVVLPAPWEAAPAASGSATTVQK